MEPRDRAAFQTQAGGWGWSARKGGVSGGRDRGGHAHPDIAQEHPWHGAQMKRVSELGTRSLKRWGQLITHAFIHSFACYILSAPTHVARSGS